MSNKPGRTFYFLSKKAFISKKRQAFRFGKACLLETLFIFNHFTSSEEQLCHRLTFSLPAVMELLATGYVPAAGC
ncbi:hypothetical protein RRU94_04165 [Domibacillus sp. DTU_2020_1001157_1_SI_ALB_TIR_016]|uniref:hypothetical protein n=1 Tax=Domibacillus sp. DTU_2020_1001157_1_SI_ALB_TIR_016 TaxID=3077789 RepID=UPI0028E35991|nr:hypothetical protein [Domibacillus sp. DTU_2020_1001157_1_SI_ALB_TIR_016]WNS77711.1 hypothetical protein RRU94_04165 [Domibacillus sp. DTU_2020_1001157_1_SI_ALB_TIR_016]